jgi:hypothetical protein
MDITHADIARTLVESTAWRRVHGDKAGEIEQIVYALNAAAEMQKERDAKIAEGFIPSGFTGTGKAGNSYAIARDDRARSIAWEIRNQDSLAASASDNSPGGT